MVRLIGFLFGFGLVFCVIFVVGSKKWMKMLDYEFGL